MKNVPDEGPDGEERHLIAKREARQLKAKLVETAVENK